MNKRVITLVLVALGILALLTLSSHAMTSSSYRIQWDTVASGGGDMLSQSFALDATAGQAIVGRSDSANIRSNAGFWQRLVTRFTIYVPAVLKSSGS